MSTPDDPTLVQQCAAGRPEALSVLHERHAPALLRFLERLLGEAGLAEDVCQEAFLRMWRKASMFDPKRGTFSAWLFRAAANLAFNRLALRSSSETHLEGEESLRETRPGEQLRSADEQERGEILHQALQKLSPGDRAIITLRHLDERPVAEVAEILGVPQGTVKSRAHYALHRLKSFLEPVLDDPEPSVRATGRGNG